MNKTKLFCTFNENNSYMEIRHLKLIRSVAEDKNLTKAADKLFLSQSALSHQLKEIESRYKTQVFIRNNKQMLLTPVGERLLLAANKILDELEMADADIFSITNEDTGLIRLSTQCYTCYHWLSSFL
jgi:LysR family transcriptional regulator for metE and metH